MINEAPRASKWQEINVNGHAYTISAFHRRELSNSSTMEHRNTQESNSILWISDSTLIDMMPEKKQNYRTLETQKIQNFTKNLTDEHTQKAKPYSHRKTK